MLRFWITCQDIPTLRFAAEELQRHLSLAYPAAEFGPGGAEIRLRSRDSHPLEDCYDVALSCRGGEITGSNPRSVLLGVYACLRRLGFRFLTPKDTYIPQELPEPALEQRFSGTAAFPHRGVCIEGADSLENVLDMVDWLPKVGFSSFFLQFGEPYFFLERWYTHVNNPTIPAQQLPREFYLDCYRQIHEAMAQRSLLLHAAGHGFTAEALGYPSIGWLPGEREPRPEDKPLIAMVKGKRELVDGIPLNTNLCYGNPEAVERFCCTVADYARQHPNADYIHVWLADAMNHVCECPLCAGELPTDQYIRLLNRLDQVLTDRGLDCRIVFLLYQELLYPPERETLQNPDRFTLMFAPISRTFQQPYPEAFRPEPLPPYRRNRMRLPEGIQENLSYLHGWQQRFQGDSFIYDYPLGKAHYGDFGYQSISRIIAQDIPRLKGLGLQGYISCQELRAFFPTGLPNYIMGHALLEGQADIEALTQEYFQAAFGEGWQTALAYLEGVSARSSLDHFVGKGPRADAGTAAQYASLLEWLAEMAPLLNRELERSRTGGSAALQRGFWQRLGLHREYCARLGRAMLELARGGSGAGELYDTFVCWLRAREMDLQPYLDVYRVQEIAGKYTGFQRDSVFQIQ